MPSGVILDSTGAVAAKIIYDPNNVVVSGLIRLPNNSFFRPFELSQTDVFDSRDNHFMNPTNSSSGANVLFTQKGFPLHLDRPRRGVSRYVVTQYVDGTSNVIMARAGEGTRLESIAGVAQQQFLAGVPRTATSSVSRST